MADPNPKLPKLSPQDIQRFHSKVQAQASGDCWPYQGAKFFRGYGAFKVKGRMLKAHRVAYFLHYGVDPSNLLTLHTCDNPPCCNPAHLYLGTTQDNSRDAVLRNRMPKGDNNFARKYPERVPRGDNHPSRLHPELRPRGEQHARAKLTDDLVREIWRLTSIGIGPAEISRRLCINKSTVENVKSGRGWGHIDSEHRSLPRPASTTRPRGENMRNAKLNDEKVREIRLLAKSGKSLNSIAKLFGVSFPVIRGVVDRKLWKHVE